jgi:hypothetical protein
MVTVGISLVNMLGQIVGEVGKQACQQELRDT